MLLVVRRIFERISAQKSGEQITYKMDFVGRLQIVGVVYVSRGDCGLYTLAITVKSPETFETMEFAAGRLQKIFSYFCRRQKLERTLYVESLLLWRQNSRGEPRGV